MWVNLKFIYGSQQIGFTIFGQRFLSKQGNDGYLYLFIDEQTPYIWILNSCHGPIVGKRCKSVLRQWVIFYNQLSVWWVFSMGLFTFLRIYQLLTLHLISHSPGASSHLTQHLWVHNSSKRPILESARDRAPSQKWIGGSHSWSISVTPHLSLLIL